MRKGQGLSVGVENDVLEHSKCGVEENFTLVMGKWVMLGGFGE